MTRTRPDSGAGPALGIVSNKKGDLLRAEVAALGWARYFTGIVGANDAVRDKPAVEAVTLALTLMCRDADEEVWFVGDTDLDMLCAVASGCVPVLVRAEPPGPGEFVDCAPRLHLADCAALERLLFPEEVASSA